MTAAIGPIEVVVISHAHPDHFDRASLKALAGDPSDAEHMRRVLVELAANYDVPLDGDANRVEADLANHLRNRDPTIHAAMLAVDPDLKR